MGAVLQGAFKWLMMTWVGVAMQKLAVAGATMVFFNFIFEYIMGHNLTGFGPLDLGDVITNFIGSINNPDLWDWADAFNLIPGLFICLNAMLSVFAWNLVAGSK